VSSFPPSLLPHSSPSLCSLVPLLPPSAHILLVFPRSFIFLFCFLSKSFELLQQVQLSRYFCFSPENKDPWQ
jgi:hypothetical protein